MRTSILCTAAGLILLGLTAGCSDHTVVRRESTETVRTQPQVYVPVPSTTEHTTVIRKDHVEED